MPRRWWYPERDAVALVIARLDAYFGTRDASVMTGRLRDAGLLDAALALPRQPYYATTIDKASAIFRSMVKNHPFADGNKRIAVVITEMFLNENGYALTAANDELADFTLLLAASDPATPVAEISAWLRRNTKRSEGQ
jgi:death-on-curing protein